MRRNRSPVVVLLMAAALGGPQSGTAAAPATMTCSFSQPSAAMSLVVDGWAQHKLFYVHRHRSRLVAETGSYRRDPAAIACAGGRPTVDNVDRIVVSQTKRLGQYSGSTFDLDMGDGLFGPGATAETAGSSEIEVALNLPRAHVVVETPPGPNRLTFGVKRQQLALNINADDDLDLRFKRPFYLSVYAGAGHDLVDTRTASEVQPRRPFLEVSGNSGKDRLRGGGAHDQLYGGGGADVVRGTGGGGLLEGDEGPDRLIAGDQSTLFIAGPGRDRIAARNGHRDWIGCGRGIDHVVVDQHEDHIRGCEHVRRQGV